jgi:methylase of polypeptide subunit release factors
MITEFIKARLIAKIKKDNNYQQFLFGHKLTNEEQIELDKCIYLMKEGYPLDYILGEVKFIETSFEISESVLIPRPETEIWIKSLLKNFKTNTEQYKKKCLIDVGTGSGILGLSLAKYFKKTLLLDLSKESLNVARNNKIKLYSEEDFVQLYQSDLLNILYEVLALENTSFTQLNQDKNKPRNNEISQENGIIKHDFIEQKTVMKIKPINNIHKKIYLNFAGENVTQMVKDKLSLKFPDPKYDKILQSIYDNPFSGEYITYDINNDNKIPTLSTKKTFLNCENLDFLSGFLQDCNNFGVIILANLPYVPFLDLEFVEQNKVKYEPKEAIFSPIFGLYHTIKLYEQCLNLFTNFELHFELDSRHLDLFQ